VAIVRRARPTARRAPRTVRGRDGASGSGGAPENGWSSTCGDPRLRAHDDQTLEAERGVPEASARCAQAAREYGWRDAWVRLPSIERSVAVLREPE
jgi:hypothetical protein